MSLKPDESGEGSDGGTVAVFFAGSRNFHAAGAVRRRFCLKRTQANKRTIRPVCGWLVPSGSVYTQPNRSSPRTAIRSGSVIVEGKGCSASNDTAGLTQFNECHPPLM